MSSFDETSGLSLSSAGTRRRNGSALDGDGRYDRNDQLVTVFEALRRKILDTEYYHPCLQSMQSLAAFPKDAHQSMLYWNAVDKITGQLADMQHNLTGKEELVVKQHGDEEDSIDEMERQDVLKEILSVTEEYEGKISDLENTISRLEAKVARKRAEKAKGREVGPKSITRAEFNRVEHQYKEGLMALQCELAKKEREVQELQERVARMSHQPAAAEPASAKERHRRRVNRMLQMYQNPPVDGSPASMKRGGAMQGMMGGPRTPAGPAPFSEPVMSAYSQPAFGGSGVAYDNRRPVPRSSMPTYNQWG